MIPPDNSLVREATATVLETLAAEGSTPFARIPRRWPVTRVLLAAVVHDLAESGLVRIEGAGPTRTVSLTPRGRGEVAA